MLAGEIDWEPGSGTLYLRRLDDGKTWRVDVPVAVRTATTEEAKTARQRERDRAAELHSQLDAREHRIDSLQAELRALAAGNPAVLPVLDRLGIRPEPGADEGAAARHLTGPYLTHIRRLSQRASAYAGEAYSPGALLRTAWIPAGLRRSTEITE